MIYRYFESEGVKFCYNANESFYIISGWGLLYEADYCEEEGVWKLWNCHDAAQVLTGSFPEIWNHVFGVISMAADTLWSEETNLHENLEALNLLFGSLL